MRKSFPAICILIICIAACKKNSKNNGASSIHGAYVEVTPYEEDITLNFVSNDLLIQTEKGSNYINRYKYVIALDQITLTPLDAPSYPFTLEFEEIDANTIKITSLHVHIPEAPPGYMTLKR